MRTRNNRPARVSRLEPTLGVKATTLLLAALAMISAVALLPADRVAHAAGPSVVQFSATTYTVDEDMTFRTLTVAAHGRRLRARDRGFLNYGCDCVAAN